MIESYIDIRVVLILVFAHGPLPPRTLPCQGIATGSPGPPGSPGGASVTAFAAASAAAFAASSIASLYAATRAFKASFGD
jgi:hypothetical protein